MTPVTEPMKMALKHRRDEVDSTQASVASRLAIAVREYQRLENGEKSITDEDADRVAAILDCDALRDVYCFEQCSIGKRRGLPVLNGINMFPVAVMLKLQQEVQDVTELLHPATMFLLNKKSRSDLSGDETRQLKEFAARSIRLTHCLMHVRLMLSGYMDMVPIIQEHRERCRAKGYINKNLPPVPKVNEEDEAPYLYLVNQKTNVFCKSERKAAVPELAEPKIKKAFSRRKKKKKRP